MVEGRSYEKMFNHRVEKEAFVEQEEAKLNKDELRKERLKSGKAVGLYNSCGHREVFRKDGIEVSDWAVQQTLRE